MVTDPLPKPVSWLLAKRARWLDHLLLNQASAVLACTHCSCTHLIVPFPRQPCYVYLSGFMALRLELADTVADTVAGDGTVAGTLHVFAMGLCLFKNT